MEGEKGSPRRRKRSRAKKRTPFDFRRQVDPDRLVPNAQRALPERPRRGSTRCRAFALESLRVAKHASTGAGVQVVDFQFVRVAGELARRIAARTASKFGGYTEVGRFYRDGVFVGPECRCVAVPPSKNLSLDRVRRNPQNSNKRLPNDAYRGRVYRAIAGNRALANIGLWQISGGVGGTGTAL
jgi:hypothetical protein